MTMIELRDSLAARHATTTRYEIHLGPGGAAALFIDGATIVRLNGVCEGADGALESCDRHFGREIKFEEWKFDPDGAYFPVPEKGRA